jgi:mRNA-degrading endonuclease RelE of RelBE toxin-antitoxin system
VTPASLYRVILSPRAGRAIAESLPESVGFAVIALMRGALIEGPRRVGKSLGPPWAPAYVARRGVYRVVYVIDDATRTVIVLAVAHRSRIYRR